MSIVKMSKFDLLAFDYDRTDLLEELQKFEFVHFKDLAHSTNEEYESLKRVQVDSKVSGASEELVKAKWTIDLLQKYKGKTGMVTSLKEGVPTYTFGEIMKKPETFDFNELYKEVLNLNTALEESKQNIHNLNMKIEELKPWEDISIPVIELYNMDKVYVTTGVVPTKKLETLKEDCKDLKESYYEVISENKGNTYIVFISTLESRDKDVEVLRQNGYNQVRIEAKGIVRDEIFYRKLEIEDNNKIVTEKEALIKDKIGLIEDLEVYYEYLSNTKLRETSAEKFVSTEKVNLIEGYVPTHMEEDFNKILDEKLGKNYSLEISPAEKDDKEVPIILENGKFTSAFENMTSMYALPKYNEIDPTPFFAPFYALFAGMMVGDLGYGILLSLGCAVGLKFFKLKDSMKQMLKFFLFIGLSTMFWGFIYGSAFGFTIMKDPIMSPSEDYQVMMILSLTLGGVHLFFGMALSAYMKIRDKKPLDALFDVGFWYMAIIGLIVFALAKILAQIPDQVGTVAMAISVIGMIGIVATGGREEKSIVGKIGQGVYSLYGITGYIGDFVSYLRLLALSLSGGFIALAINKIVGLMFGSGIIGAIFGAIVFVAFQLFNVFLSFLSAYVHTARLTYVEMFNKFYEGGGKAFKGLINKSKYFNIKNENN